MESSATLSSWMKASIPKIYLNRISQNAVGLFISLGGSNKPKKIVPLKLLGEVLYYATF
jgi:hypothetical protein